MLPPRPDATPGRSRRSVLALLGLSGLAVVAPGLTGCSTADREALLAVDPRRVRPDEGVLPRTAPQGPTDRELRRRAVRAGSLAALAAYAGAGDLPPLAGRTGGAGDPAAALEVHRVHASVLAGVVTGEPTPGATAAATGDGSGAGSVAAVPGGADGSARTFLPPPVTDEGGPTIAPPDRPAAVLATGVATALRACRAELAADDAQVPLALVHARVAAARAAQAAGLRGAQATALAWPTSAAGEGVVAALQDLLAQEHRARWSFAVVVAWSDEREADADAARDDHTRRTEQLTDAVLLLGADPVAALPTYGTDDAGTPVDGPVTAAALALRLEDAVAAAGAALLAAAVEDGSGPWLRAAVRVLAEAERARWSWGGAPVPWPGTTA